MMMTMTVMNDGDENFSDFLHFADICFRLGNTLVYTHRCLYKFDDCILQCVAIPMCFLNFVHIVR